MSVEYDNSDGIATVTISCPGKKNALDKMTRIELARVFEDIQDDVSVRSVILTGDGADFCGGADVRDIGGGGIADSMVRIGILHRMMRALVHIDKPVVAAVRGVCIGVGWSLALACDYIIAAEDSRFQFAFRHIGLAPDGGATHLLASNIGMLRAKELIYSGRFVSGTEALALGLATEALPEGDVLVRARAIAAELSLAPTLALRMAKLQFAASGSQTFDDMLASERAMQPLMVRTEDFGEGTAAFRERRAPRFKGQ